MGIESDHYGVLGVAPEAEFALIRAAYRSSMRNCHPDRNSGEDDAARARLVNEAYRVLRDPEKRAFYDRHRGRKIWVSSGVESRTSCQGSTSSIVARHEIAVVHLTKPLGRTPMPAFAIFVVVAIGGLAALLASGLLDRLIVMPHSSALDGTKAAEKRLDQLIATIVYDREVSPAGLDRKEPGYLAGPSPDDGDPPVELPPVLSSDVAEGAGKFARISLDAGIAGAQQYSVSCHKQADLKRSWSHADRCVAFDITARYVDADLARSTRSFPNAYFAAQTHSNVNYRSFGVSDYAGESRLAEIERAIVPRISTDRSSTFSHVKARKGS